MTTKIYVLGDDPQVRVEWIDELDTLFAEGYEVRIDNSKLIALYKPDGVASEDKGLLFETVADYQHAKTVRSG
jgi:hypothetical protein